MLTTLLISVLQNVSSEFELPDNVFTEKTVLLSMYLVEFSIELLKVGNTDISLEISIVLPLGAILIFHLFFQEHGQSTA